MSSSFNTVIPAQAEISVGEARRLPHAAPASAGATKLMDR
jgi:hypothetical protein